MCSHYGWLPDELDRQDAHTIEIYKNILIGRNKAKNVPDSTQMIRGMRNG